MKTVKSIQFQSVKKTVHIIEVPAYGGNYPFILELDGFILDPGFDSVRQASDYITTQFNAWGESIDVYPSELRVDVPSDSIHNFNRAIRSLNTATYTRSLKR